METKQPVCEKSCNCVCHKKGYELPDAFWQLIAGYKAKKFNIKFRKKDGHITIFGSPLTN